MAQASEFGAPADLKIILLGDSAVGKSKLLERFLLNDFNPQQLSTYALTLYRHKAKNPADPGSTVEVEFWDTAGQERFQSMHPSYYISAHACILCFDLTRKVTYKNLDVWYDELVAHRGSGIPVIVVANKVDMDPSRAKKSFGFVEKRRAERAAAADRASAAFASSSSPLAGREKNSVGSESSIVSMGEEEEDMPLFMCSASDGTNVVAAFREAIRRAFRYKEATAAAAKTGAAARALESSPLFVDEVLNFLREEESRPDGGLFRGGDI